MALRVHFLVERTGFVKFLMVFRGNRLFELAILRGFEISLIIFFMYIISQFATGKTHRW